jgi:RNA polymerase sigma-70 factor, ECF subfamily
MGALQTEVGSAAAAAQLVETLHERYAKAIRRYCLRRLHSPEEADDATQVVYLTAYRCLAGGIEPRSEGAWLFKIAENVVLQRRRALARRARVEYAVDVGRMADALVAPAPEATPELDGVREALATMPETQRQAIVLREWYGLSYREVASELGVSSTAVEALIFRARRGLVRRLEVRNRLTQNGRRFGLWLPAGPLKYLFGGGGVGAKVVVGAASIAVVAATTQPHAPGIVLSAAETAPVTTPAPNRVAAHHQRPHPGGSTHRLRTLAPVPPRSDEVAASGAPAAPPVPDVGGWRGVADPASLPTVVADSGASAAGAEVADLGAGASATPPTSDSGASPAPDTASPSSGPPTTTPSGKTPPAVGRTPDAVPPGHADQALGTSDPPGLSGSSPGLAKGHGQDNGNADAQGNGNNSQANGPGAPTGTAPGQSGQSDRAGSSAPAAAY